MNQAVRESQGEWVIFMNAGDRFADNSVLDRVDKSGCLKEAIVFPISASLFRQIVMIVNFAIQYYPFARKNRTFFTSPVESFRVFY